MPLQPVHSIVMLQLQKTWSRLVCDIEVSCKLYNNSSGGNLVVPTNSEEYFEVLEYSINEVLLDPLFENARFIPMHGNTTNISFIGYDASYVATSRKNHPVVLGFFLNPSNCQHQQKPASVTLDWCINPLCPLLAGERRKQQQAEVRSSCLTVRGVRPAAVTVTYCFLHRHCQTSPKRTFTPTQRTNS
jgi:hypothetical protein